ncbi:hypothetical protein GQ44DRAFT_778295 [Phaeosphaeriaceae sp. PMI808]|nr:hypothetical protein GQ44DRAFT_778295 [Phaeosphaeriaceae sp. PMI808]
MAESHSMKEIFDAAKAVILPSLPPDSWYIIAATTLLSARGSQFYGQLYQYTLDDLGENPTAEARQRLMSRLMEVMIKSWTLVGAPSVIAAWYSLRHLVQAKYIIHNESRQKIAADPEFRAARAKKWFSLVFKEEEDRIFSGFADFPEFEWALKDVIYGSFLSDLSILGQVENEMVVLACVAGQGAGSPVLSHYKGLRRVGTSAEEAKSVGAVIEIIAHGLGVDTSNWHTAEEVESYFIS